MRLLVLFDLPVVSTSDRKIYAQFRNFLLKDGFIMMQFSVYSRICKNSDDVQKHINRVKLHLPQKGNIRLLQITENQYDNMIMLCGQQTEEEKISVDSLLIF